MAEKSNSLEKLFIDSLKDIYDAEHQIIEAMPKMVKEASHTELRKGLEKHLEQSRKQAERLEKVFEAAGKKASRKHCVGMEGLIKEAEEHMQELKGEKDVLDAAIIASAQKVEHYEIAAYGTAKSYARMLGNDKAVKLLDETLQEEFDTDTKLTELAEHQVNLQAMK